MSNQANFSPIYELSIGGPSILTEQLLPAIGIDLPGSLTFLQQDKFHSQTVIQNYQHLKFNHPL